MLERAKWGLTLALTFAAVSFALSITATAFVALESGRSTSSIATNVIVDVAYWPSILLGLMNDNMASPRQLVVNSAGWAIFGALVAIIIDLASGTASASTH